VTGNFSVGRPLVTLRVARHESVTKTRQPSHICADFFHTVLAWP
jgi:hypothetical protein